MRFWSCYVFIAGPIAWLGLILAQAGWDWVGFGGIGGIGGVGLLWWFGEFV